MSGTSPTARRPINTFDLHAGRTLTSNLHIVVREFTTLGGVDAANLRIEVAADAQAGDEVDEEEDDASPNERVRETGRAAGQLVA